MRPSYGMDGHTASVGPASQTSALENSRYRWTVHPLRQEPARKSVVLALVIVSISVGVACSFDSGGFGFLSFGLLTAAMSRYFLPTRYTVDDSGLSISHLGSRRRLAWSGVRRAVSQSDGLFLSPFSRPHRLDPFRGTFVRFAGNREEILRAARFHLPNEPV